MSGQPLGGTFTVSIAGRALPDGLHQLLVSAVVEDNLNLPDLVLLRFRDPHREVLRAAGATIGAAISVTVAGPDDTAPVTLVEGEVTALEAEYDETGTYTVIRGFDASHRLFRGRRTESYLQLTASDAVKKVAARAGLQLGTVDATSTVFPHLSQGGVSDWEFLRGLAQEIGYEVAVRGGRVDFRRPRDAAQAPAATSGKDPGPLVLQQGSTLLRFRAAVTAADQVKEVQVRGWDVARKQALVAVAPARTQSVELPDTGPAALAHVFNDPTYISGDVPYRTQAEVDAAAEALADRIAGAFAEMEGVARGNPRIRAGAAVAVDSLGSPFDGKYVVTVSRHCFEPGTGYRTHFSVTGKQERSLLGLAGGGPPVAVARSGVVLAQVSDVKDPQGHGRVRLVFPWLSDDFVSDWARTVQAAAGKDRGAMLVPEVGDEVLVAFEHGDLRRPYVVGNLYNGVDTPPDGPVPLVDEGAGAINRRSVVSRRGHRLDLLDQDGQQEGVRLATGDGKLTLLLDAVGTAVTVHSDGSVTVDATQDITLQAKQGITLDATKGITLDAGTGNIDLKGRQISLTAKAGASVDGGAGAVDISTKGTLSVSGTLVRIN